VFQSRKTTRAAWIWLGSTVREVMSGRLRMRVGDGVSESEAVAGWFDPENHERTDYLKY
jgi:hypothetical protein